MLDVKESGEAIETQQGARGMFSRIKFSRKAGVAERHADGKGLRIPRLLCAGDAGPFETVEWEQRQAKITDDKGKTIFVQDNVEVPKSWSMLATTVVGSKYFYGRHGTDERERSVRQLVHRVARTIADWGLSDGYFASTDDAENFYNELAYICLHQYGAFNSPVWFNVGLFQVYGVAAENQRSFYWNRGEGKIARAANSYEHPQSSACFIQAVEDTMEDIMRLAASEAMLFKYGSGTGTDLSTLRSSREKLSGGGTPSGPLSFMRVFDQVAAVIKSGGKTRRAAKMQSLKVGHPDIMEFIACKMKEEKKACSLIDSGYDGSFGGEAYASVMFQNANLSVRLDDEFMKAVENDGMWQTKSVTTGEVVDTYRARDIMRLIAEGAYVCGDPGAQYDTTINRWHTCKNSGRINASNPCSEFMFVDNSACNLASINLMRFYNEAGSFDMERFRHVVRTLIVAQDILVDNGSYPSAEIAANSHAFRPLGLGYANLGALLMAMGLPYDSDEGRTVASAITALMTGCAYAASQEVASVQGTFEQYEKNKECILEVIQMHRDAAERIDSGLCQPDLRKAAVKTWEQVAQAGPRMGFRNAQVTLLAPTGTIGFMMDCDTTGVEPDIALIKYKQLAGGGIMKIVNRTLRPALKRLGYGDDVVDAIVKHVDARETIEGAPGLKAEHLAVFDCAFRPKHGTRSITYQAHLKMMAAVQPLLSGAISKTVNLPGEASANEIMQAYIDGWKMGLKSVAVYRDGSKRTQPLNTEKVGKEGKKGAVRGEALRKPLRQRMPATRDSITHKFEVSGHEGYLTVGMYEDGSPGELFIIMAKEGSMVGGIMDAFGTAISLCLQYGVPLKELVRKFSHSRFEPSGFTPNPDIPMATSIVDYIFRWLEITFPNGGSKTKPAAEGAVKVRAENPPEGAQAASRSASVADQFRHFTDDAPACDNCGAITVRNGACYRCFVCGSSMGCS